MASSLSALKAICPSFVYFEAFSIKALTMRFSMLALVRKVNSSESVLWNCNSILGGNTSLYSCSWARRASLILRLSSRLIWSVDSMSESPMISSIRAVTWWAFFCITSAIFSRSSASVKSGLAITWANPLMMLSGVRISWLMFWMKAAFIFSDSIARR